MAKLLISFCLATAALFAQGYKVASMGGPPEQLAPGIRDVLSSTGVRVTDPNGFPFAEVWLRSAPVADNTSLGDALQNKSVAEGALVGAVRYAAPAADLRGQGFGTGVYTLRYAGGDSVLLINAANDQDANARPLDQLQDLSRKVSKTDTPATLRLSVGQAGAAPRLEMTGGGEWIVHMKSGETPVDLLIVGLSKG